MQANVSFLVMLQSYLSYKYPRVFYSLFMMFNVLMIHLKSSDMLVLKSSMKAETVSNEQELVQLETAIRNQSLALEIKMGNNQSKTYAKTRN